MKEQSRRQRLQVLQAALESERATFLSHWRDISEHVAPRRPRFYTSDVNRGDRRNQKIVHTGPVISSRTLRAGLMSGITSPARPWFKLTIADMENLDEGPVKDWLDETTKRMNGVFSRSNLYNCLLSVYGDLGNFATAALLVEEDDDYVLRNYSVPLGSFSIGLSDKLRVEIFFRDFQMTVRQIVQKFGLQRDGSIDWSNISLAVRTAYDSNHLDQQFVIVHAILPNEYFDETMLEAKFKKYASLYYEKGSNESCQTPDQNKFLRESGYDYFPVLVPRWETTGEDAWGTNCPGMEALGDMKQLQLGQRRMAQAIDLLVKPPMKGPTSLRQTTAGILPGKITYVDERGDQGGFKPVFQIEPRIQELQLMQQDIQKRIADTFYETLFLMISQANSEMTATEVNIRQEEKLLALGPVLEQLNQDLLDPLIELTFDFMWKKGMIPQPPEEIQNKPVKVEYISIMAQAQKLAGLSSIDRFTQYISALAERDPSVLDKVDTHVLAAQYADICSMPAAAIREEKLVQAIQSQKAQAAQADQKAKMMMAATQGAKNLSQADLSSDNALNRLIQQSNAGSPLTPDGVAS
jgi:hypothetical protein